MTMMIFIWIIGLESGLVYNNPVTTNEFKWLQPNNVYEDIVINEIVTDGRHSYVDLACPGCPKTLNAHYALYILKPHGNMQDLHIVSELIIPPEKLKQLSSGNKYLLIGNPKGSLDNSKYLNKNIPIPYSTDFFRLYSRQNEWLDVSAPASSITSVLGWTAIILTKSTDPITMTSSQGNSSGTEPKLIGSLYESVRKNQIDGLVIRGPNTKTRSMPLLDSLLKTPVALYGSSGEIHVQMPPAHYSLSRYVINLAYNPTVCQSAQFAPGYENDCPGTQEPICPSADEATASFAITINDVKRRKVEVCSTSTMPQCLLDDPEDPDSPFHIDRKNNLGTALNLVPSYQSLVLEPDWLKTYGYWLEYILTFPVSRSKLACYYCRKYCYLFGLKNCPKFAGQAGIMEETITQNKRLLEKHPSSKSHKIVMETLGKQKEFKLQNFLEGRIDNQEQQIHVETNRHMPSVFTLAKNHMSFSSHVDLVELQKQNFGTDSLGQHCKSKDAASAMTKVIGNIYKKDLIHKIRTSDTPFSLILDGSTTICQEHVVVVLFQFIGADDTIQLHFYKRRFTNYICNPRLVGGKKCYTL